jgi:hypothetical protein
MSISTNTQALINTKMFQASAAVFQGRYEERIWQEDYKMMK